MKKWKIVIGKWKNDSNSNPIFKTVIACRQVVKKLCKMRNLSWIPKQLKLSVLTKASCGNKTLVETWEWQELTQTRSLRMSMKSILTNFKGVSG